MNRTILFVVSNHHKLAILRNNFNTHGYSNTLDLAHFKIVIQILNDNVDEDNFKGMEFNSIFMDESISNLYTELLMSRCRSPRGRGLAEVFERLPFTTMELISQLYKEGQTCLS
jgi:hypothetical protein